MRRVSPPEFRAHSGTHTFKNKKKTISVFLRKYLKTFRKLSKSGYWKLKISALDLPLA